MQLAPIKPTLEAPGTKRVKLEFDKLLTSFAFKFNLRRYTEAECDTYQRCLEELEGSAGGGVGPGGGSGGGGGGGRRGGDGGGHSEARLAGGGGEPEEAAAAEAAAAAAAVVAEEVAQCEREAVVGRCRLTLSNPRLKAAGTNRLELTYDGPLSNFAFSFNLRRYTMAESARGEALSRELEQLRGERRRLDDRGRELDAREVGRCRLTVSKPELKARLVSALETRM